MKSHFVVAILLLLPTVSAAQEAEPPYVDVTRSYVRAIGKWKGDEVAFKHVVQIECVKGGDCMEAQAALVHEEPDISVQHYEIVKWDANGLVAENKAPICVTNQIIINFGDKSVLEIDLPKTGATGVGGICKDKAINRTKTYRLVAR